MEKETILKYLKENKVDNAEIFLDFLNSGVDLYSRDNKIGHITSSAFILDNKLENALLILHAKYNKWFTTGGHVDENETSLLASIRESKEELGLDNLELIKKEILEIDIHKIPEKLKNGKVEQENYHFDVRYLFKLKKEFIINPDVREIKDFKFTNLKKLVNYNDISIKRQAIAATDIVDKLK